MLCSRYKDDKSFYPGKTITTSADFGDTDVVLPAHFNWFVEGIGATSVPPPSWGRRTADRRGRTRGMRRTLLCAPTSRDCPLNGLNLDRQGQIPLSRRGPEGQVALRVTTSTRATASSELYSFRWVCFDLISNTVNNKPDGCGSLSGISHDLHGGCGLSDMWGPSPNLSSQSLLNVSNNLAPVLKSSH